MVSKVTIIDEILYSCQVCDSTGLKAKKLTWYFPGAERRQSDEELSKPAWYCTTCVTSLNLRNTPAFKGPRLDNALRDHERDKL